SALLTDIVFLSTNNADWATASLWLLGAGLVMAVIAAIVGFADFLGERQIRVLNDAWIHMIGNGVMVVIQAVNFFIRYLGDPAAAIPSSGIYLSVIGVLIVLFTGWKGGTLVFRRAVGVEREPETMLPETELRRRTATGTGRDEARPPL